MAELGMTTIVTLKGRECVKRTPSISKVHGIIRSLARHFLGLCQTPKTVTQAKLCINVKSQTAKENRKVVWCSATG